MSIIATDVLRDSIVTIPELQSDGYSSNSIYLTAVLSTTSATKTITVNLPSTEASLLYQGDYQVNPGDILYLFQTQPSNVADGYYTVNHVSGVNTVVVNEVINSSTNGFIQFRYNSGASIVGFNPTNSIHISHNNVQKAIEDIDFAIPFVAGGDLTGTYPNPTVDKIQNIPIKYTGTPPDGYVLTYSQIDEAWEPQKSNSSSSGLTPLEHESLRQLIHLADGVGGPFEGFLTGSYREITGGTMIAPTTITWWTSSAKVAKIVDKNIIYNNVIQPETIQWRVYGSDGITVLASVTDSINYNLVFEVSRTRMITDYTGGCDTCPIDANSHETLRQLIHLADGEGGPFEGFASGAYKETTYLNNSPFVYSETWYTDNSMQYKIVENVVQRNSINLPTSVSWTVYDVDGETILNTVIDTINYVNNIFEINRTRSIY